jgi:hypothetical protein
VSIRVVTPSNFSSATKIKRRIGRFKPRPIASVATRTSASPVRKRSASRRRTAGESEP